MLDEDMDCEVRSAVSLEALRRGVLVVFGAASECSRTGRVARCFDVREERVSRVWRQLNVEPISHRKQSGAIYEA